MSYVAWEFYAYSCEPGSNITRLANWNQVYKTTGIKPKGLDEKPDKPENATYLFDLYTEIKKGADGVSYRDIQAYQDVTGERLSRFEVGLMIQIDTLRREHGRRNSKISPSD